MSFFTLANGCFHIPLCRIAGWADILGHQIWPNKEFIKQNYLGNNGYDQRDFFIFRDSWLERRGEDDIDQ
jgi:hypothetical protein